MEVGGRGRLYTYRYTVTTRMTSALRWAAMRAVLIVSLIVRDKVTRQPAGTVYQRISGLDKNIAFLDYVKCFNYALSHDDDDEVMLNVLRCQLTY